MGVALHPSAFQCFGMVLGAWKLDKISMNISNHISRYFKHLGENQKKFPLLLDVILDTAKEHAWRLPRCPQLSQKNVEYSRKFVQHLAAVNLDIDIKQGSTMQVKFSRTQQPAGRSLEQFGATSLPAPPGRGEPWPEIRSAPVSWTRKIADHWPTWTLRMGNEMEWLDRIVIDL